MGLPHHTPKNLEHYLLRSSSWVVIGSSSSSPTVDMVQPAQMWQAEVDDCCILQVVPAGQETIATEAEKE